MATAAAANTWSNAAANVVREYLAALARGDKATAASYLQSGLPTETFLNASAHVLSVRAARVGAGSYSASADVQTASGEYYITFTLEPGPAGLQIVEHDWIKPQ